MNLEELQNLIFDNFVKEKIRFDLKEKSKKFKDFQQNYPEAVKLIYELTDFLNDVDLSVRFYHILNNFWYVPKCNYCKTNYVKFKDFQKGYAEFCCNKCMNFGVRERRKNTCFDKYGVSNPAKSKEIKEKTAETNYDLYGGKAPACSPITTKKMKQTSFKRYGVEFYSQTPEFVEKMKNTKWENNGDPNFVNPAKAKKTCQFLYGVNNPFQSEEVKSKLKQTNLKKYGVENPAQNPNIYEKSTGSFKNSWHNYQLPSGELIHLQGYEPQALDELLKHYNEKDILYKKSNMPEIGYITEDNKNHRYYPDFYIPKDNLVIEVKSDWTYKVDFNINLLKEKATKKLGYKYNLIII